MRGGAAGSDEELASRRTGGAAVGVAPVDGVGCVEEPLVMVAALAALMAIESDEVGAGDVDDWLGKTV